TANSDNHRAAQYALYTVLWNTTILFAPICPHITEEIYHTLFAETLPTVHAERWPIPDTLEVDGAAREAGDLIIEITATIRTEKAKRGIPLNVTLEKVTITASQQKISILRGAEEDLKHILHIKEIEFREDETIHVTLLDISQ
ncbi:class I tRNA ligase family protein, partial [Candidatus Bathyarchaeota archaeon]|nr:class I tRNA ligase family protein [Candidatus Bathyarchaeota archaeon]